MSVAPFWKEVEHPTTFDWWEFHHDYFSYRLRKLSSVKTQFSHQSWWHLLQKNIKKCWLRFKNDLLIYCSIENVVHRELLPGNFWTFLHNSNYTHKQALSGGSSDWAFSKYCCECKLLQTLVKSLKICLKEFFVVKLVFYIVQNITLLLFFKRYKVCSLGSSDQDSFYSKTFSSKTRIICN